MDPCSTGADCHRALAAFALTLIAFGCSKPAPPAPQPPNVQVAEVIKRDVPIYVEAIGQTRGAGDRGSGARPRVPRIGGVRGRVRRPQGQAALHDRPAPVRGGVVAGQGAGGPGGGRPRALRPGRRPLRAAGRAKRAAKAELDTAVAQANAGRANRGGGPGRSPRAQITSATPRSTRPLTASSARPRSTREPGGPRTEHAPHPHLADRHDPRSLHRPRAGLPATTRAGARSGRQRRSGRRCRSSWSSPTGPSIPTRAGSCSWTATWTPRPARSCSRRRSRTRVRSCGRASSRACVRRWT